MAAKAQRRIQADLAWLRRQQLQDLFEADRTVHAGRRLAAVQYFLQLKPMLLRVELLVLLFEAARMGADIADSALVGDSLVSHGPIVSQINSPRCVSAAPPTPALSFAVGRY